MCILKLNFVPEKRFETGEKSQLASADRDPNFSRKEGTGHPFGALSHDSCYGEAGATFSRRVSNFDRDHRGVQVDTTLQLLNRARIFLAAKEHGGTAKITLSQYINLVAFSMCSKGARLVILKLRIFRKFSWTATAHLSCGETSATIDRNLSSFGT